MITKMCKSHKPLLVTKLIFCSNPKVKGKILGFCRGNQDDANFQVDLQKYITTAMPVTQILP